MASHEKTTLMGGLYVAPASGRISQPEWYDMHMCINYSISVTDIITAAAAVGGLIIAAIGLSTWKKQIRGVSEYELAKRLMLEVYQLRDALRSTRNPFLSIAEGDKDDTEDTWQITAYKKRWAVVSEVLTRFNVTSLEAEVVWDDAIKKQSKEMDSVIRELYNAVEMYIRQKNDEALAEDFYRMYDDIIYDKGDNDKYNTTLNKAVKGYETILKPHLKK